MEDKTTNNFFGTYKILKKIGSGGMGEVYLASDPNCNRTIAIKKIKENLKDKEPIRIRFLREAKIAAQLTHPSILPIYNIHQDNDIYYTMPFIDGKNLKDIFKAAKQRKDEGLLSIPEHSIPSFIRIFLCICEAMAYVHTKKILHRDIKPNNILVGKYGEVLVLDWGIASYINNQNQDDLNSAFNDEEDLTRPGKISGTLNYMAPERAFGKQSSIQTEIYSLGIILYQMLTLISPFKRTTVKSFRQKAKKEILYNPITIAPDRDIPNQLNCIVKKCLALHPKNRYQTMQELIDEIKNYIEGRPAWIPLGHLSLKRKEDWMLQENILLAKHIAITRNTDIAEWVRFMIGKGNFQDNILIKTQVTFKKNNAGIGFLLSLSGIVKRRGIENSYCFWLSTKTSKLLRSFVLVKDLSFINLKNDQTYNISIERIDNKLILYIDNEYVFSFTDHLPIQGGQIGLIYKDNYFDIKKMKIFSGNHNVMVNCLAVPDAFFKKKDYDTALLEYRKIASSFNDRIEGREALFRAGLSLLEKAKTTNIKKEKTKYFDEALAEFSHLHGTFGEPLEHLGKSLTYAAIDDIKEEAKCLELAIRKFDKHPLTQVIKEHIIFRSHEGTLETRETAYRILLIALRFIPNFIDNPDSKKLIETLIKHWEPLPYFYNNSFFPFSKEYLIIQLSYRLGKTIPLIEICHSTKNQFLIENIIFCLIRMKATDEVNKLLNSEQIIIDPYTNDLLKIALTTQQNLTKSISQFLEISKKPFTYKEINILYYLLQTSIDNRKIDEGLFLTKNILQENLLEEEKIYFDSYCIHLFILNKQFQEAQKILESYPSQTLNNESLPLHYLYGCYIYITKNQDMAMEHFSEILDRVYPTTTTLLRQYVHKKIDDKNGFWFKQAFFWEKEELFRQLALFSFCKNDNKEEKYYLNRLKRISTSE